MLDVMTPAELEAPETVKGPNRERIAASSGVPVEEVVKLLFFFKQSKIVYTWLHVK